MLPSGRSLDIELQWRVVHAESVAFEYAASPYIEEAVTNGNSVWSLLARASAYNANELAQNAL